MIGCTKLLCGTATVSEVIKYGDGLRTPAHLLQFSGINRPLVVWNMTNRCNLRCKHCYINAEDTDYSNELSTEEAVSLIKDLAAIKIPVLLFSGGEPLLRKDIFELGKLASDLGLRPVISSNGTLIDDEVAVKIREAGFQYVGISLDGSQATHDDFRNRQGAFEAAIKGIQACLRAGVKSGVRMTVNKLNYRDLPEVIDVLVDNQVPRFCMYHLVYAGRAKEMMENDLGAEETRQVMEYLHDKTIALHEAGVEVELLTTDNHADGVYLYQRIKESQSERSAEVIQLLEMHGGCSAGTKFANIDPQGNVHPCQFWQDYTVGNVRERSFGDIWNSDDPLMVKLREKAVHIKGKCGTCDFKKLCSGCRIRAREAYGDIWAEDPACYLSESEMKMD